MKSKCLFLLFVFMVNSALCFAQSTLYPQHFDLASVTLLDGPLKVAQDDNARLLLKYDADRLMTPFVRQAGLSFGRYANWQVLHPSFMNWGLSNWSLEGHVGGHYLSALSLAYAAVKDEDLKSQLKSRLDYCVGILKDCQNAFSEDTRGMKGFIGGQPCNQVWTGLYARDLAPFRQYGGWVPFYCEHKVLAGLRDAWVYAGSDDARDCFEKLADWSVNVVSNLSDDEMQSVLGWEHGGMNEVLADAYHLLGDSRYLTAARRYSHKYEIDGMKAIPYNQHFLDNQHANTQVPKYIGFNRIWEVEPQKNPDYRAAAINFWEDVVAHRTTCIGGNSTSEHFFDPSNGDRYLNDLDGPESCNSNNMLKLSENLFDDSHDARYVDFYENVMYNHILSTRDPKTGGYVYFTTLRPQGYRIYSQVNQAMWCCVGTGMENHSKYGHFVYTHDAEKTLYVNLFVPSELDNGIFGLRQETSFPYSESAKLIITRSGTYTIAVRHPSWAGKEYQVKINGVETAVSTVVEGVASYVFFSRTWQEGDVLEVHLPMSLRYEECPGQKDYVAFKYGPILLAAKATAESIEEAQETGLKYEALQNEYAGEGRMDHAPGSRATAKDLSASPLLIDSDREQMMRRISADDETPAEHLRFSINAYSEQSKGDWSTLTLEPFFDIHHARYICYWYSATKETYDQSDWGRADAERAALNERTLDFVAPGEQQSEAGHQYLYSNDSSTGVYNGELYRDAKANGFIQYTLANSEGLTEGLSIMLRLTTADKGRQGFVSIDGARLADITVESSHKGQDSKGFYNLEILIPSELMLNPDGMPKSEITFRLTASATSLIPGLYYVRLLKDYTDNTYVFRARDWITGDAARVSQSSISYDDEENTITVHARGQNNVALSIDWQHLDYEINASQKYLIIKGSNLSLSSGANYLWWLNGVNKASQIAPTFVRKAADGEVIIAWNMAQSTLDGNNIGERFSVTKGATIFGLTSTTGVSVISNIGFYESVSAFEQLTSVRWPKRKTSTARIYGLDGRERSFFLRGINMLDGVKYLKKN